VRVVVAETSRRGAPIRVRPQRPSGWSRGPVVTGRCARSPDRPRPRSTGAPGAIRRSARPLPTSWPGRSTTTPRASALGSDGTGTRPVGSGGTGVRQRSIGV